MALFNFSLFADETKEAKFWKWFQTNEERLFAFEKDREKIFHELTEAMNAVDPNLTFEFSPLLKGDRREFVISAGGIKTAFNSVEKLHAVSPKMKRWTFVKFRPRRTPVGDLEYGGEKVRSKDVHYLLFKDKNPEKIGLMIFLEGFREEEKKTTWGQIGYLLLDEALGEYDVEMKVGSIVFQSRESKYYKQAHPLSELPRDFDESFARRGK